MGLTRLRGAQVGDNSLDASDIVYSLDDAYDNGGSGVGRTITADAGAVVIDSTAITNAALTVTGTLAVSGSVMLTGSFLGFNAGLANSIITITSGNTAVYGTPLITINQNNRTNNPVIQINNIGAGAAGIGMTSAGGGTFGINGFNSTPTIATTNKNLVFDTNNTAYDSSQISFLFTETQKHISYPNQRTFLIRGNQSGFKTGSYFEIEKSGSIKLMELRGDPSGNALFVSGSILTSGSLTTRTSLVIQGDELVDDVRIQFRASDESNRFTIESDFDASTANDLLGFRSTSTDNILVLKGNGNIGISTLNPSERLDVNGNIKAINITGSLTKLSDGTDYLLPGINVQTVISSSGAVTISSNNIPLSFLGDASDGTATLDATGSVGWASLAGSIYTMTRDAYLRNLTINSGVTLRVAGFLPFVKGTLTNNGIYEAKGNDATGATAGAAISNQGSWNYSAGGGGNGAGPTTGNSAGSNASGAGSNSIGGGGGKGGDAGAQGGGTGNTTVTPVAAVTGWRDVGFFVRRRVFNVAAAQSLNGSGGGGGGAVNGDGVNSGTGGGGGGAAANCYVFCDTLNNPGTIRAVGGGGANGTSAGGTTKAGGGGGGAGGGVIVAANTVTALGTVVSTGGAFGNGANGGANGNAGTAGTVLILTGS